MQNMNQNLGRILVLSDLHLWGSDDPLYRALLRFIDEHVKTDDKLFIVGDLFDLFIGNKIVQQKTQFHLKQSKYYWTFNETVVLKEPIKLIIMDTYIKQRVDPMPLPSTNIFEINTEETTTGKICSKCNHKIMERPLLNSTFIGCLC